MDAIVRRWTGSAASSRNRSRRSAASSRNPNLRRIELAFAGSAIGNYAFSVAIAIFAFHQGGVAAVGIVTAVRQAAAASIAPFAASLSDRFRRERVMLASDAGRIGCTGGIAVLVASGAPTISVYALAVGASVFGAVFRPAEASLVPLVATIAAGTDRGERHGEHVRQRRRLRRAGARRVPDRLLGLHGRLRRRSRRRSRGARSSSCGSRPERACGGHSRRPTRTSGDGGGLRSLLDGFRTIAHEPRLRLLIGLYDAQCFVAGTLGVLIVATAIDLLGIGNAGVGVLQSACGVGAIAGAGVALTLVSRSRLGRDLALGLVLWGVPLIVDRRPPLLRSSRSIALAVLGIGNTLVDISAMTLIQRTAIPEVAGRIFGVLESSIVASLALGALAAPALITLLGTRGALLAVGRDPAAPRRRHEQAAGGDRRRRPRSRRSRSPRCAPCRSSRCCRSR